MMNRQKTDHDCGWWRETFGSGAWLPLALIVMIGAWLVFLHWLLNL